MCPDHLGNIHQTGRAQPWGLGSPWYKLETPDVKARSQHGHPPPIHSAQFLHKSLACKLEVRLGTVWVGRRKKGHC